MVNLSGPILDMDGDPFGDVTIASVCVEALLAVFADERDLPGEKKMERFILAQRIKVNPEVDLTSEETSLVKMVVAKGCGPLIVGRVWTVLDPATVTSKQPRRREAR